jgi:dihydroorotase
MAVIPFLMLTESTTRAMLEACAAIGIKDGKIYPKLRTTKSEHGVTNYAVMLNVVRWCGELGIKVHAHFEHPNMVHCNRDAEFLCLPIAELFLQNSAAIIVWEHGSDGRCVQVWKKFASDYAGRFFVTITAHHLVWTEDDDHGDVRKVCKPSLKTQNDILALTTLIEEDHEWVMAGSDIAPHDSRFKHVSSGKCSCGEYTAPFIHPLYAHGLSRLFTTPRGVDVYVNFTSRNARKLHGLPASSRTVILAKAPFEIPSVYQVGYWKVEPPGAGDKISFSIVS